MIAKYLDKDNLHHAYLIEGTRDEAIPEIFKFCQSINIKTSGNPDFVHISIDNFKIDEAFSLRAMGANKSFSEGKKMFVICANNFSLDAQNVLLKMFEEPIANTHFFLIVPDTNALLKTFTSRFYLIKKDVETGNELAEAEKFISMPQAKRIDFIKNLLVEDEEEDEEGNEIIALDSARSKALRFLNMLETVLSGKLAKNNSLAQVFHHFFKVREYLRMPGSSPKTLMESIALVVPIF